MSKRQDRIETVFIFLIVLLIVWMLGSFVLPTEIAFIIGLFAGFIISGRGFFYWVHKSGK